MPSLSRKKMLSILKSSEIVIVNGSNFAVALDYIPRHTPVVVAKGRGKIASDVIWAAQENGIPIVEVTEFGNSCFSKLRISKEVPKELFGVVSKAMSFLYKSANSPHFVRFVKPLSCNQNVKKSEQLASKLDHYIEFSQISLEFGKKIFESVKGLEDPLDLLRHKVANETGFVVPEIIASLNNRLPDWDYHVCIRQKTAIKGISEGIELDEFVTKLIAKMRNLIIKEAWQFLGYVETEAIVAHVKKTRPTLYREVFGGNFSLPSFRFILRNLLKEGIPIKDIEGILEAVSDNLKFSCDPDILTEFVRSYFAHYIFNKYSDSEGILNVIMLSPEAETRVRSSITLMPSISIFDMGAFETFNFLNSLRALLEQAKDMGVSPVLFVNPSLRRYIRRFIEPVLGDLPVVSYSEVILLSDVRSFAVIP